MKTVYERVTIARKSLHLSQEYVAKVLDISTTEVEAIESGDREISTTELNKLSNLFGVSVGELVTEKVTEIPWTLVREFGTLSKTDQQEVLDLIATKRQINRRENFR